MGRSGVDGHSEKIRALAFDLEIFMQPRGVAVLACARSDEARLRHLLDQCGLDTVVVPWRRQDRTDLRDALSAMTQPRLLVVVPRQVKTTLVDVAAWRRVCPGVPLLLLVRDLEAIDVAAAVRAGADGVLAVDGRSDAFARSVHGLLRGEPALPRAAVARLVEVAREAPPPPVGRLAALSPRELYVLRRLALGLTVGEVAREAGVAETTIRSHLSRAVHRLRVSNPNEAIAVVARANVTPSAQPARRGNASPPPPPGAR
jgi:DNA-binding NarL/FixJ family response regulator